MKILVVLLASICCISAQYRPPRPQPIPSGGGGRVIAIIRQEQDVNVDGSYRWSYETENGIAAQEQGSLKGGSPDPILEAQGQFQYTAPDGTPIALQYISNENGFQPQGAHLPTPPPIPAAILRALEYNAAHPEEDDGVVRPGGGFRRQ